MIKPIGERSARWDYCNACSLHDGGTLYYARDSVIIIAEIGTDGTITNANRCIVLNSYKRRTWKIPWIFFRYARRDVTRAKRKETAETTRHSVFVSLAFFINRWIYYYIACIILIQYQKKKLKKRCLNMSWDILRQFVLFLHLFINFF